MYKNNSNKTVITHTANTTAPITPIKTNNKKKKKTA